MESMIGGRGSACKAPGPAGFARRADAAMLAAALAGGLVLCGDRALGRAAALAAAGLAPDAAALEHRVDLAAAGTTELQLLPGVGPTLAGRIEAERAAHGPFASLDEVVRRVPGVGPARVRSWRGRVVEARGGSR